MKQSLRMHIGLAIGTVLLACLALWYWALRKPAGIPFDQLPGTYQCEGFGLPDADYSQLKITPEMVLFGIDSKGSEFQAGRLSPRRDGAEIEYDMNLVHHPSFNLDPFFAAQIIGDRKSITVHAKQGEAEFTKSCKRL